MRHVEYICFCCCRAPAHAGSFELRYVTGHGNRVLARQAGTVVAAGDE